MNTPARPTLINNRYLVGQRIGRGGMADVYLAQDRRENRDVAVKILFAEYATDPNFVERFRREAQAAASLDHPNIVDVFDWGRHNNTYYIAMEYVAGRTLADILRANGSLTSKQTAEIAGEVAAALGFAHSAGLVHRDIKPANILVGTNGSVKVADFGIARALNSAAETQLTQVGAVMGTATYFSPEQAQGAQPDPRSDLYSLGVVMYEMIAGRPPFLGDNPVAIAYKQVHDYPTPLNQLVVDVPRPFEAIVAKLLTKDPNVRYSTADALREDLRRFGKGEVPVALQSAAATARLTGQSNVATTVQPATGRQPAGVTGAQRTTAMPAGQQRNGPPTGAQRRVAQAGYDPRRQRGKTGWYALAAFFALVAVGIAGYLLYNALNGSDQEVDNRVPNYVGQPVQTAIVDLTARNLTYRVDVEANDQYGPGIVHRTDPAAGTVVQAGQLVVLVVTPDETLAAIPEVAGETVERAREILEAAGFSNIVEQREPSDDDDGTALRTDPSAGTEVSVTSTITLFVAQNDTVETTTPESTVPTADYPNVIGNSESTARDKLSAFDVQVEYAPPQGGFSDGQVMDQRPRTSNTRTLEVGATVNLTVADAPDPPPPTQPPQTQPPQTQPPQTQSPQTTTTTLAPQPTAPPASTPSG